MRRSLVFTAIAALGLSALVTSPAAQASATLVGTVAPETAVDAFDTRSPSLIAPASKAGPAVGDCTFAASWGPFVMDGGVVDCAKPHTGQTVYVGEWTSKISPAEADSASDRTRSRMIDEIYAEIMQCEMAADDYLGTERTPSIYRASQFYVYFTGPSPLQWARGERWFRCDVVAFKHPKSWAETARSWLQLPTRLQMLPPAETLRGFLSRPDLGRFTQCQAQRDGSGWYELFNCRQGVEIVASVIPKRKYATVEATRRHVTKRCLSAVERLTGKPVSRDEVLVLSSGCATVASSWVCGRKGS